MMTEDQKQHIARAITDFQERNGGEKEMSQQKLAAITGVSPAYISHIINANWNAVPAGAGKTTAISDATWKKISLALGMDKDVFDTVHFKAIYATLALAKKRGGYSIIDAPTGSGKSFTIAEFRRRHPGGTFVVKCSNSMSATEFIKAMALAVGANTQGSRTQVLEHVAYRLRKESYGLLIIDEAETILRRRHSAVGYLKDLYDMIEGAAGIVICGANNVLGKIKLKASMDVESYPQVLRRFGSDPCVLGDLTSEDAVMVCSAFGITDKREINALRAQCPSPGHLFQVLRKRQEEANILTEAQQ
jgi:transcriptional regulator with XRE-family HTH domain